MSFATEIEAHTARLGIAETVRVLARGRRTLEQWRAGREPDNLTQRGALEILRETPTPERLPKSQSNT